MAIANYEKTKKCPLCGADVLIKYKATHNEVRFVNGYPTTCENNGKRNIDIASNNEIKVTN